MTFESHIGYSYLTMTSALDTATHFCDDLVSHFNLLFYDVFTASTSYRFAFGISSALSRLVVPCARCPCQPDDRERYILH
jgi:hypothetical protein